MAAPLPLIFNPRSAGGEGDLRMRAAVAALAVHNVQVEPVPTAGPGGATPLAERLAREGHATILAVGGDGTHNEAAEGVLRSGKAATLGLLPGGTANDFLSDLGVADVNDAARRIGAGIGATTGGKPAEPRAIDAALVRYAGGERHFINVFHTLFAARVGAIANRRFKWMGPAGYKAAVLSGVATLRSPATKLVVDGKELDEPLSLVAVCNTRHTGGKMDMAPMAVPDDGLLDVIALKKIGRVALLRLFPKIFPGTHIGHPKVIHLRGKRIEIRPAEVGPLLFDGEVDGSTPCTIAVKPRALQILA